VLPQSLKMMEGTKHGVTFACVNAAKRLAVAPDAAEAKQGDDGVEMAASTWAVRFYEKKRAEEQVTEFLAKTRECMQDVANAGNATENV
jgi:hypothetical protein